MLRWENRKFAFLDSYHRRKKSFGFVFKKCSMIGSHHTSHFSVHKSWLCSASSQRHLHPCLAAIVPKMLTEPWQQ